MLKKSFIVGILCLITFSLISCTTKVSLDIEKGEVVNLNGESLTYYLGKRSKDELSNKLLVVIQGSGRESVKNRFGMGASGASLGFDILYIEKYAFNDKELFNKTNSRNRRINDIKFTVEEVVKNVYEGELKEILIVADSEGGVIAPEIAYELKETITHMIIMGAGGYPQRKEFQILLEEQLSNEDEGFLEKAGIKNEEGLINKADEIRNNPTSEKFWLGHTYKYWNSYIAYSPLKYLKRLNIPTLYIIGKKDKSVPYESVKYLSNRLEDKDNFRFEIISGLDHNFNDESGNNKLNEIMKDIINPWYEKHKF